MSAASHRVQQCRDAPAHDPVRDSINTAVEPYKVSSFDLAHELTVEEHRHTALITISHPPANTQDRDSPISLRQLIGHLNRDDDIYALVVTGQGPKFLSAGADLSMFADGDKAHACEMTCRFDGTFEALHDFRGVSIAATNGYAMSDGLECALICDARTAGHQAQMVLPEAAVGPLPCADGTQASPWLVGKGWAKRMILCNERVDAETTLHIGLAEQVMDSGKVRGATLLLVARMTCQSPATIRTIKPLIQGARERASNTWLLEERERFVDLFGTQDTCEGVNAFFEKRNPKWRNC